MAKPEDIWGSPLFTIFACPSSLLPVQFEGSEKLVTAAEMVVSPPQPQPCPKNWPSKKVKSPMGIELGLDGERVDSALVLEKQP